MRAILGLVLAGAAVGLGVWFYQHEKIGPHRAMLLHQEIATRVLGEYLAHHCPGQRVLVVANPFTLKRGLNPQIYVTEESEINGLRKGVGDARLIKIAFPQLRTEAQQDPQAVYVDPQSATPLSFLVAEDAFDALAKENPDRTVVVSLIGLPVNLERMSSWTKEGDPRFALFLPDWRMVGNKDAIRTAFQSGKIIAAVVNRPGAPPDETPLSADYQGEFAKRFLLVTVENLDALIQAYPRLF